ncbi:MAG TPA: ureidoglycolate lyase, partial [Sphingomonadales bacterium]|nr:ureidoglycolate lyase [Sphingomonadales bacterium]
MLAPKLLTRDDFLPFGEVIESAGRDAVPINFGHARRFHRLASVDCQAEQGEAVISIVTTKPWPSPIAIRILERHPISTQAFIPLIEARFLVVVAERCSRPRPENIQAFVTNGRQGINYGRGTWHHPLLALSEA